MDFILFNLNILNGNNKGLLPKLIPRNCRQRSNGVSNNSFNPSELDLWDLDQLKDI